MNRIKCTELQLKRFTDFVRDNYEIILNTIHVRNNSYNTIKENLEDKNENIFENLNMVVSYLPDLFKSNSPFSRKGWIIDDLLFTFDQLVGKSETYNPKKIQECVKFGAIHSDKVKIVHTMLINLMILIKCKNENYSLEDIVLNKHNNENFNIDYLPNYNTILNELCTKFNLNSEMLEDLRLFNLYRNKLLHKESLSFFSQLDTVLIPEYRKLFKRIESYIFDIISTPYVKDLILLCAVVRTTNLIADKTNIHVLQVIKNHLKKEDFYKAIRYFIDVDIITENEGNNGEH